TATRANTANNTATCGAEKSLNRRGGLNEKTLEKSIPRGLSLLLINLPLFGGGSMSLPLRRAEAHCVIDGWQPVDHIDFKENTTSVAPAATDRTHLCTRQAG